MNSNKVFVGWWNKSLEDIEFSKTVPDDVENWELVRVYIETIPEGTELEKTGKNWKKLEKTGKNWKRTANKLDKSVRDLVKSTKKWSKM